MDDTVLRRAQHGDPRAQEQLLREIAPAVEALIRRLGARQSGEAEDQLHDIFAHILSVLPKFLPDGAAVFSTWVFTVVTRWLLMERRKRSPTSISLEHDDPALPVDQTSEQYVEGRELHALLERSLAALPADQRQVFVLTQLHQCSLDEVAASEGIPLNTVKSRLFRARAALVLAMGSALERAPKTGANRVAS